MLKKFVIYVSFRSYKTARLYFFFFFLPFLLNFLNFARCSSFAFTNCLSRTHDKLFEYFGLFIYNAVSISLALHLFQRISVYNFCLTPSGHRLYTNCCLFLRLFFFSKMAPRHAFMFKYIFCIVAAALCCALFLRYAVSRRAQKLRTIH